MSATDQFDDLCIALQEGRPLVLLLGQDSSRVSSNGDPAIDLAFRRLGHPIEQSPRFLSDLLGTDAVDDEFYDWFAEACMSQPDPDWIEPLAELPLNALFTSSINPAISRWFRIRGRDVTPILSNDDSPASPRDRRNLHATYLFGRAGERQTGESPPGNILELRRRGALHAQPLLSRIVETATPLGILLVDGVLCGRDWITADSLYGVLSAFGPRQVLWFGEPATTEQESELLRELSAPNGPIVFVRERLSVALKALELAHRIHLDRDAQFASAGTVRIRDQLLEIDPAMRLRVSTIASIVEDSWLAPLAPIGDEHGYDTFRRFHGQMEDAPRLLEGVRRGFAIERTVERTLYERVRQTLETAARRHEPILIHGQSASGKSVALANLALKIRREGTYPVLLASRSSRLPAVEELDDFCLRAEEAGAEATLVICDGNAPADRYSDLLRGFTSRGRRVVVVGSTYRILDDTSPEQPATARHFLEIPSSLDENEHSALISLFQKWTGEELRPAMSEYILPAVYHMLPEARPTLAAGLAQEARAAEDDIRSSGKFERSNELNNLGRLGHALVEAGVSFDPKALLEQKLDDFLGSMTDAATQLVNLVMVPGKLDCPVPVNLLMRTVGGSGDFVDIAKLLGTIDLFRWTKNDQDDVFIHPRLRIEAQMISARRLGTAHAEVEVVLRLLRNAIPGTFGSCERRFVLDLVHRLGPDGPFGRRYARRYLDLARALTELRARRGVLDPSLMLQEATLRRRLLRDSPDLEGHDAAAILDEAREIVEVALAEFDSYSSRGVRRACANLKVERAAIYGFRAVEQMRSGATAEEVWQYYVAARDSARSATFAVDSYFANDVSVWVPNDLLRDGQWSPDRIAELTADIWDGIERVDRIQLDPDQLDRFDERRANVAQTLGDRELEEEAIRALDLRGSGAGTLLRARSIGGMLSGSPDTAMANIPRAQAVVSMMHERYETIRQDARCLRYFLRAIWLVATRSYLFGGERLPLPRDDGNRREILEMLDALVGLEGGFGDPRDQYLRAVLLWRDRRENAAKDVWRTLAQETAFSDPRRVVKHHIWTDSNGKPVLFHGRIMNDGFRGRATVRVEEIRQDISLLHRDFPDIEFRRGAIVPGGFHIAFNFIGPIADPPRRVGDGR